MKKNVRLCALKYGIGEGNVGRWTFCRGFFCSVLIYGLPRYVIAWSKCACEAIALRRGGLLWLGSYDSAFLKKEFFYNK